LDKWGVKNKFITNAGMFRKIGAAVVHYNVFSLHEGTEVLVPWDIEENSMKQSTEWENHGPTLLWALRQQLIRLFLAIYLFFCGKFLCLLLH
jgi:hypothetical protein